VMTETDDIRRQGDSVLTATAEFSGDISNRQTPIAEIGTVADIEHLIDRRLARALDSLDTAPLAATRVRRSSPWPRPAPSG
ncbi:MAG: hypothetical protein ACXWZL_13790, partial [Mycobacterium sp.]